MLGLEEGKKAVIFARNIIENFVANRKIPADNFDDIFKNKQGVFVTIHTYPEHDLRGCIGIPLPVMSLKDAIKQAAQSATKDPRFPPLKRN